MYVKIEHLLKIPIWIFPLLLLSGNLHAQEVFFQKNLESISYDFNGKKNYERKKNTVHVLAYNHSKEVSDVFAGIAYHPKIITQKLDDKGFKTMVFIGKAHPYGDYMLSEFDIHSFFLPTLKSISLHMLKDDKLIYIKNPTQFSHDSSGLYFSFLHQRFSPQWKIKLKKPGWQFLYSEADFISAWEHINNYYIALKWVEEIENYKGKSIEENFVIKTRFLNLLHTLKTFDFYNFFLNELKQDPLNLDKRIQILSFKLEKEILGYENQVTPVNLNDFTQHFFSFEYLLQDWNKSHTKLYGDLYFKIPTDEWSYFDFDFVDAMLDTDQKAKFESFYQNLTFSFIDTLIQKNYSKEALLQLKRFETFYQNAGSLSKSDQYKLFKARAVYDIYLSYINVAKQSLKYGKIDLAINYLDKASEIQERNPAYIINNLMVEKALMQLLKKAMIRHQNLIESGETESAKKIKYGIEILLNKLKLDSNEYPMG